MNGISGDAGTNEDSPNKDFLQEVAAFIEECDDSIVEVGLGDGVEANVNTVEFAPPQTAMGTMSDLKIGIQSVKQRIKELEERYNILKAKRVQLFETQ